MQTTTVTQGSNENHLQTEIETISQLPTELKETQKFEGGSDSFIYIEPLLRPFSQNTIVNNDRINQ